MQLSVVIPARNAAADLPHLFAALLPQLLPGDECVLVDDASQDATAQVAASASVTVLQLPERRGPAAARNHGVDATTRDVIVFLDADVVPHPSLLEQIRGHFRNSPEIHALMGSYDRNPHAPSTVSRFRNLLHCYTHHTARPDASTFWAGCGAVRRKDFLEVNGFDAVLYPIPSVEDIELGMRLKRAGKRILLDPSLQVQHRKAWTLSSMLRTDLMQRAIPWTRLLLSAGAIPQDLNLKLSQRLSGGATAAMTLLLPLLPWYPITAVPVATLLLLVIAVNWPFYKFLAHCGNWRFAAAALPAHLLYFLCCTCGALIGTAHFCFRSRRETAAADPAASAYPAP